LTQHREVQFERGDRRKVTERRLDLAGPVRCSAAIVRSAGDNQQRLTWHPAEDEARDTLRLNPSRWKLANSEVLVSWPEMDGALAYEVLRSTSSTDPVLVKRVKSLQLLDSPPVGKPCRYWLRPIGRDGPAALLGPIDATSGRAVFSRNEAN
jgi:hypothetical protein